MKKCRHCITFVFSIIVPYSQLIMMSAFIGEEITISDQYILGYVIMFPVLFFLFQVILSVIYNLKFKLCLARGAIDNSSDVCCIFTIQTKRYSTKYGSSRKGFTEGFGRIEIRNQYLISYLITHIAFIFSDIFVLIISV